MIHKIIERGIGYTIFAAVFAVGEAALAPRYFRNLALLFLHWEEFSQEMYPLPTIPSAWNALFLAWALALLVVMVAISNVGTKKRRGQN